MVRARRRKAVKQLKRFLKLPEYEEVDERDIPIVCLGGSGGGFRAVSSLDYTTRRRWRKRLIVRRAASQMLGFLGTMEAAKEAGMWDLIMYTAGVSGSCWALGGGSRFCLGRVNRVLN